MRSVRAIQKLAARGYMGAAKAVMKMLGVDVGPARLPCGNIDAEQTQALRSELEQMGFFEWVRA
jgi:N-acetylneuraminate lyase